MTSGKEYLSKDLWAMQATVTGSCYEQQVPQSFAIEGFFFNPRFQGLISICSTCWAKLCYGKTGSFQSLSTSFYGTRDKPLSRLVCIILVTGGFQLSCLILDHRLTKSINVLFYICSPCCEYEQTKTLTGRSQILVMIFVASSTLAVVF